MALITAPASFLASLTASDVWFERRDFETRSTFTAKRQVLSYPSASLWRLSVATYPKTPDEAGEWRRFLMKLRGRENWFQCPQPLYPGPATGYAGACQVDGAGQAGFTLTLKAMTPNAPVLAAGDFFTVVDQCFVADADLTADATGKATLSFDAPLRTSPADGAAVELAAPYFLCASASPDVARWQGSEKSRLAFTFEGAEHI